MEHPFYDDLILESAKQVFVCVRSEETVVLGESGPGTNDIDQGGILDLGVDVERIMGAGEGIIGIGLEDLLCENEVGAEGGVSDGEGGQEAEEGDFEDGSVLFFDGE